MDILLLLLLGLVSGVAFEPLSVAGGRDSALGSYGSQLALRFEVWLEQAKARKRQFPSLGREPSQLLHAHRLRQITPQYLRQIMVHPYIW